MSMEFLLRALDPNGVFVALPWTAPIIPRIGDTLMLFDGRGDQDVTVADVVFHRSGRVEVWLDGFSGWEPGSVASLFDESGHKYGWGGRGKPTFAEVLNFIACGRSRSCHTGSPVEFITSDGVTCTITFSPAVPPDASDR